MKLFLRRFSRCVAGVPPATRAVFAALVAVYAMQCVVARAPIRTVMLGSGDSRWLLVPDVMTFLFAISGMGLSLGFFWTPVSYAFLHGGLLHLCLNAAGLAVFGPALEREAGARVFWAAFLASAVVGGAGWALAQGLSSPQPCVGASAAVLGLAGAFAALRPRARFAMLFPVPCVLPAWAVVTGLFALNALELGAVGSHVAYFAHLSGIAAGAAVGGAARLFRRGASRASRTEK